MSPRKEIKSRAKNQLGNSYFSSQWLVGLLACVVVTAITVIANIIPVLGSLVVLGPVTYGLYYMFITNARNGGYFNFSDIFKGFSDCFFETFILGFMISLFTFLWSLLFIIPGIIKALDYSMAYFVKIDHPEYDWRKCMDTSAEIMRGNRGKLFALELSFIPFAFISALLLGVGSLWLPPYQYCSIAHFYLSITDSYNYQPAEGDYTPYEQVNNGYDERPNANPYSSGPNTFHNN